MSGHTAEKAMGRRELRIALEWFCGCGTPSDAATALLYLLQLHPLYDHREEFEKFVNDDGLAYLTLYWLAHLELTEHGGTVDGGWLTDSGEAMRAGLEREESDNFEALFAQHCIHGYDSGDPRHDCLGDDPGSIQGENP